MTCVCLIEFLFVSGEQSSIGVTLSKMQGAGLCAGNVEKMHVFA